MNYGTSTVRAVYFRSPSLIRDLAATAYSLWERPRKFTAYTDACFAEIQETERWTTERQLELRAERLRAMLQHAAARVPYWQAVFQASGVDPGTGQSPETVLAALPLLDKEAILAAGRRIWALGFGARDVSMRHTSGTTGAGLVFPLDWPALQREYAYSSAHRAWAGIRRGMRVATFAGHPVAGPSQRRPPFWAYSKCDNELFFSSQHMSERNLRSYMDRLRRFGPEMIQGYPSSVYLMASYLTSRGIDDIRPQAVFTGSETLFPHHRAEIAAAFGVAPLNWYGNAEMVANIVECRAGLMHIRELHSVVEVVDELGRAVSPGESGELVCTSLGNRAMPLFRYRIGDTVTLASETSCACGRGGRLVEEVVGRVEDVIVTPDGKQIGRLDHIFKDLTAVREAQIVQRDVAAVTLKVVRRPSYTDADSRTILHEARLRLGDAIRIDLEFVDEIPRGPNGKFRFAVSSVPSRLGRGIRGVPSGAR